MQVSPVVAQGVSNVSNTPANVSLPNLRAGGQGELIVSEFMGRFYELAYRGFLFHACTQAPSTIPATIGATAATASLSNSVGSGKNLILLQVGCNLTSAAAAASDVCLVGLINLTTAVTHTTPGTVNNCLIGGPAGVGLFDVSSTLPTAPTARFLLTSVVAASSITPAPGILNIDGGLIIPPGGYVAVNATSAVNAMVSFLWAELPQ